MERIPYTAYAVMYVLMYMMLYRVVKAIQCRMLLLGRHAMSCTDEG